MNVMRVSVVGVLPLLLLQACAYQRSTEVTEQMARTEAVLQQAQGSNASEYALAEFQQARNKYADARTAYEKESESGDRTALRLAQQAEVDARFALAKAQAERQQQAAREVQQGVETLRNEANRSSTSPANQAGSTP